MKLSKIEKVLKRTAEIDIFAVDDSEVQWIGNRYAWFPLYDFPKLRADDVYKIINIEDAERKKHEVCEVGREIFRFDFSDYTDDESEPVRQFCTFNNLGATWLPIQYEPDRVFIVDECCLKPFYSDKDNDYEFRVRKTDSGSPYMVVKRGMEIAGIINGFIVGDDGFIEAINDLARMIRLTRDAMCPVQMKMD